MPPQTPATSSTVNAATRGSRCATGAAIARARAAARATTDGPAGSTATGAMNGSDLEGAAAAAAVIVGGSRSGTLVHVARRARPQLAAARAAATTAARRFVSWSLDATDKTIIRPRRDERLPRVSTATRPIA